jgi:phosphate transport system substrate-binding protein
LLVDIFLGAINNWNDPRIAKLNPGVRFGNLPITIVHRADGSGTTYIVTDYLSEVSAAWKTRIGTGKTVSWPASNAIGEKGTEGVAAQIRTTPGAIGYVELAYALQTEIAYAMLQNRSGTFVLPSSETVSAAAATKPNVTPTNFSIVDQPGVKAYPIDGYSWVLLYRRYPDAMKQKALHDLFVWMLADGQGYAKAIDYVPLPPVVSKPAIAALNTMGGL